MDFNVELTEFPSAIHSNIYFYGRIIMQLSRTSDAVSDYVLRESCKELHDFLIDMLSDMYNHPEEYHLPVMKLEEFYDGKNLHEIKRKFPAKFKSIYAQSSHAVSQYLHLLFWIGYSGTIKDNTILVSVDKLQDISKRVSTSVSPIKFIKRMEALNRVGLMMENLPTGESRFISKKYPDMLPALHALAMNKFDMFDFRNINGEHIPTHDDYFYPLHIEQRELALELHNFVLEHKLRPAVDANRGVVYNYKSKQVIRIAVGDDLECFLDVNVIGKDRKDDLAVIDKYLKMESQELQEQSRQHLTGCDANRCIMCSTYASGNYVTVLDKYHQMCGTGVIGYGWRIPDKADMAIIKQLIKIRCKIIDEAKTTKKTR